MAVIVGGLAPRTTVTDNDIRQLESAFGVHALSVEGQTFVYVAGYHDDGISAFVLGADGSLDNIQNIRDTALLELENAANFASATVGGTAFLYVSGANDNGLSAFRVNANGTLTSIQNIDDDTLLLNDPAGRMAVAQLGANSFLISSSKDENALSVFRINGDGTLLNTDTVVDTPALNLNDAMDVTSAMIGSRTFVFVAGEDDSGLSVFELLADGTLSNTDNVSDDATLKLGLAYSVTTATAGGVTYLVATGLADGGLSVFSVSGAGTLANVFNLSDSSGRGLAGSAGLTTFTFQGESFVAVSARQDNALSVFHVGDGGVLTDVSTVFDTAGLALSGSLYNAFGTVDGHPLLIASGLVDNGVSTFELGGDDDRLVGTSGADFLLGLNGNDWLDGMGGGDRMLGGWGNDVYVVNDAGDRIEEGAAEGTDTVRSSISFVLGQDIENLSLLGKAPIDGTGNWLANEIHGNTGGNTLRGAGGRDDLLGRNGADRLLGGSGADDLKGGKGGDVLIGGSGRDSFIFGALLESGTSNSTRDQVVGFRDEDRIVLRAIDAVKGTGNQAFELDRDNSFSAGEIRVHDVKAGLIVEMNVDNDSRAEMSILLKGFHGALDGSDFLF